MIINVKLKYVKIITIKLKLNVKIKCQVVRVMEIDVLNVHHVRLL